MTYLSTDKNHLPQTGGFDQWPRFCRTLAVTECLNTVLNNKTRSFFWILIDAKNVLAYNVAWPLF